MFKKDIKSIPRLSGVYLFKGINNVIIYIGKAKSLKFRVASYFQRYSKDWKVTALLDEATGVEYIITGSDGEAQLLEAQLIQEYRPKYNVIFKDGQPFVYLVFTKAPLPTINIVRNKGIKGTYFGPFLQKTQARAALSFLLRTFRLMLCNKKIDHGCLDYHLNNCAGNCRSDFDKEHYLFRLQLAKDVLKKDRVTFIESIKQKIKEYSAQREFEKAKKLNDYLQNVDTIFKTLDMHYSQSKYHTDIVVATVHTPYMQIDAEKASQELQTILATLNPIKSIDCFDISHFQSHYIVGSCIRFTNGRPDKNKFRRFAIKTLTVQNDYAALQEIVGRRYKNNDFPDLIIIDGGKGQLNAVANIMSNVPLASIAKREEILYSTHISNGVHIDMNTDSGKLLIALRDYAHHFAISYHRLKRKKGSNYSS